MKLDTSLNLTLRDFAVHHRYVAIVDEVPNGHVPPGRPPFASVAALFPLQVVDVDGSVGFLHHSDRKVGRWQTWGETSTHVLRLTQQLALCRPYTEGRPKVRAACYQRMEAPSGWSKSKLPLHQCATRPREGVRLRNLGVKEKQHLRWLTPAVELGDRSANTCLVFSTSSRYLLHAKDTRWLRQRHC